MKHAAKILPLFGVMMLAQPVSAQPYNVDKFSPLYAARWALEAFYPVDRLVLWRSDIEIATIATPDLSSMAHYAESELRGLLGAIAFAHGVTVAPLEQANFVICVGPTYTTTNVACDGAYLTRVRADWYARGLVPAVPDLIAASPAEDPPVLDRCAFFTDKSGSIGAAYISIGTLDGRERIRNCLIQGLGLGFWRIEAFFHADYSTDENTYGIRHHEVSLLQAAYAIDRQGCGGGPIDVACFQAAIERIERQRR
jgi:hypothetical protein